MFSGLAGGLPEPVWPTQGDPLPPRATLDINGQGCGPDVKVTGLLSRVLEIAQAAYPASEPATKPAAQPWLLNCVNLMTPEDIGARVADFISTGQSKTTSLAFKGTVTIELQHVGETL